MATRRQTVIHVGRGNLFPSLIESLVHRIYVGGNGSEAQDRKRPYKGPPGGVRCQGAPEEPAAHLLGRAWLGSGKLTSLATHNVRAERPS